MLPPARGGGGGARGACCCDTAAAACEGPIVLLPGVARGHARACACAGMRACMHGLPAHAAQAGMLCCPPAAAPHGSRKLPVLLLLGMLLAHRQVGWRPPLSRLAARPPHCCCRTGCCCRCCCRWCRCCHCCLLAQLPRRPWVLRPCAGLARPHAHTHSSTAAGRPAPALPTPHLVSGWLPPES